MKNIKIILGAFLMGSLIATSIPVFAGSGGRRNTAIGLSAATLWNLAKGHYTSALVFGAGSAVAWKQYEIARKRESRRHRYAATHHYSGAAYSPARYRYAGGSAYHGRTAAAASSGASAAALKSQISDLKQSAAIRQAAMQQNLNELAAQTQALQQQNGKLRSELITLRADNATTHQQIAQAQAQSSRNGRWALLAALFGLASLGGMAYAFTRHPMAAGARTVIQAH